mmetsp:Transcript_8030/g.12190  ORF Transcript_8030/g.12190 Transcript_8030/m.12190 type:complete len:154 (+) Transcript_8030:408-869(+)
MQIKEEVGLGGRRHTSGGGHEYTCYTIMSKETNSMATNAPGTERSPIGKNDVTIFCYFPCCLSLTQPHKDGRTPAPVGGSPIESRLPRSTVMDTIFHGYVEVAALVPIGTNTPLIDHLLPLIWTRELPHQPRGRKQLSNPSHQILNADISRGH